MKRLRGQAATLGFAALMALFSIVVVSATGYHLKYLRETELRRLDDAARMHARVFEGDLTLTLNVIDHSLRHFAEHDAMLAPVSSDALLRSVRSAPYLRSLSVIDKAGRILASSNPENVGLTPELGGLMPEVMAGTPVLRIAMPWAGRDFQDGRRATADRPAGPNMPGFVPVLRPMSEHLSMLAAINPDYFLNRFEQALQSQDGAVEVLRADDVLMFSSEGPGAAALPGQRRDVAQLREASQINSEPETALEQADALSGAYRISRIYPLAITVRMNRGGALRVWYGEARTLLSAVIPAFLLTLGLAFVAFRRVQSVERERQDEELRSHDRLAGRVFDASAQAIVVTDANNRIVRVNRAYVALSGYSEQEAIGQQPSINRSDHQDEAFYKAMWHDILNRGFWRGEIINRRKDGACYPVVLTISVVRDERGQVANFVALLTDISERKEREDHIRFLSEHDFLTGLPNRGLFQDRVMLAIAQAKRAAHRLGVMFIDLDRFKPVNDTFGHHVGDRLLQEVARRLSATVRESDTVARQGGDEFLVMLPRVDGPEDLARVAEKLMRSVSATITIGDHDLHVTPSIGIAVYPEDGGDLDTLIRAADTAMYHSKSQGRAAYHFYSEGMNKAADDRLAIEAGLRRALDHGGFRLAYQPLVTLASGQVTGAEALLRWREETLGEVSPASFIPIAEECGLIGRIGDWVLREACRQARIWHDQGRLLRLAVNASPVQFERPGFVDDVLRVVADHGLAGEALELEVTEGVLLKFDEPRAAGFEALRRAGIRLAIDDFGTGYSSLSYLRRLQVDKIKIDKSFVADVNDDPEDAVIVGALIDMAHSIGLRVVAEGVETTAQQEFLRLRGCDEVQGFLLCRPLELAEFESWLDAGGQRSSALGTAVAGARS